MRTVLLIIVMVMVSLTNVSYAKANEHKTKTEQKTTKAKAKSDKLKAIAYVVYCEDKKDDKSMRMVLSTIYNRSGSHSVDKMYEVIKAKSQYTCYKGVKKANGLGGDAKFKRALQIVEQFINNKEKPITVAKYFTDEKAAKTDKFFKTLKVVGKYNGQLYFI